MSMEIPVVATKSGGMEEVIVHGVNGLLCEVYNAMAIADALEMLAADPKLAKELGIQGRASIVNGFTIQEQTDIFEAEYKKLLQ